MQVGMYARVSTQRQAQAQTIEQQLTRLRAYVEQKGWHVADEHVYRDDGFSGASLSRPGLDRLRDRVALAELDVVVITAPDRLARKYLHQVLLIEEMEKHGCRVEFADRPMSTDPNDQLLLQIRGAVAEYERSLISERMRRGKVAKLRTGQLLPWTRATMATPSIPIIPAIRAACISMISRGRSSARSSPGTWRKTRLSTSSRRSWKRAKSRHRGDVATGPAVVCGTFCAIRPTPASPMAIAAARSKRISGCRPCAQSVQALVM